MTGADDADLAVMDEVMSDVADTSYMVSMAEDQLKKAQGKICLS